MCIFKNLPQARLSIGCLCVFWLVLVSAACGCEGPEQRLLARFHTMQEAVEEGRMRDFMDGVSEDFSGTGGVDRKALHAMLRARALARSNIRVTAGPVDVVVRDGTATVRVTALLTGGSGRFLPDSAQAYEITSGWREEDGQWRVYYAEWKGSAIAPVARRRRHRAYVQDRACRPLACLLEQRPAPAIPFAARTAALPRRRHVTA